VGFHVGRHENIFFNSHFPLLWVIVAFIFTFTMSNVLAFNSKEAFTYYSQKSISSLNYGCDKNLKG
jgi:hypothetical protein